MAQVWVKLSDTYKAKREDVIINSSAGRLLLCVEGTPFTCDGITDSRMWPVRSLHVYEEE